MLKTFGVLKLSDEARDKLTLAHKIISLVQAAFSAILIINSIYINFTVAPNLNSEKAVIRLIFTVIAMLATQLAVYYLSGIFVCRKCHTDAYNCKISGDRIFVHAVPWSCCRLDYDKQCFHDPIQQYQYLTHWDKLHEESVNNIGCIEILRQPIENCLLCFILLTYFLLFFQMILTVISRYLYTSYRNAVILGDPFGVSPGWILSKKTPSEIMAESRVSVSTYVCKTSTTKPRNRSSTNSKFTVAEEEDLEEEEQEDEEDSYSTYCYCN